MLVSQNQLALMPYVHVSSNVSAVASTTTLDENKVMAAISKGLATALDKPEQVVMVRLSLNASLLFQATDAVSRVFLAVEVVQLMSPTC